jgi:transcriptional regulator with XRE-family HTH domain
MTTGRELRTERRLAEITVTDVAARMGLSRQAVSTLEQRAVVNPERVEQYRAALRDAIEASGRNAA